MGKITLEFDSIEENEDALNAINANKWRNSFWELDQHYRSIYKYSEKGEEIEIAEQVREKIREILSSNELFL